MTADKIRYIANSPKHQAWTVYCQVLGGKWVYGTRTTKEPRFCGETSGDRADKIDTPHEYLSLSVACPQQDNCVQRINKRCTRRLTLFGHPRVDKGNVWKKVQTPNYISILAHREDESSFHHPGGCD
eukprot:184470-Heterocapsa_arctica.AAC.1